MFLTVLIALLFAILSPNKAHAEEAQTVQVTPADPSQNVDTSTVISTVTIATVEAKIDAAQTTLNSSTATQGDAIIATIQANVPNTTTQQAATIATTQEPIAAAVETATVKIQEANTAIQSAETAVTIANNAQSAVESQTAVVAVATQVVASAGTAVETVTSQVESQTAVVAIDQTIVATAQAVVDANTTPGLNVTIYSNPGTGASPTQGGTVVYTGTDTNGINEQYGSSGPTVNSGSTTITETFTGNKLNTTIGITVDGTSVSTTNTGGGYIASIGFPGPGQDPSLSLYSPSKTTTITMPTGTTSAGFEVFAKNGNTTGLITYTDGTTETYLLQDNVNSNYQNYVHRETFAAPAGKTIATVTIPTDWDYFAIDNVSATKPNTAVITEDFQVKWDGIWTPQTTGTQYITAPADDGVKLYLDGQLVINDWVDKGGGGSTADVETTAGVGKTFEMWYYENGGGANVSLLRYNGSTWEVIPGSEFSTSSATPEQKAALASAQQTLVADTTALNTLQQNLTTANQNLTTANQNLTNEQQNLTTANQNLSVAVQTADSLANTATTKVNEAVSAMSSAAQVAVDYYAEQRAIAAENARIAAEAAAAQAAAERAYAEAQARAAAEAAAKAEAEAKAAAEAAAKAEAEAKAAAEAAAKAEADRIAAEEAAAKAEADRVAAEEAAAKAEAEAKEKAEADAKAEAERLEAEAEAARQAEENAKAEAEAKAQEEANAKAEAEAKQAEADKLKAEAEAKEAEQAALDKAIEDAKAGKELTEEQKDAVVATLIEDLKPGEAVSSADIKASGIEYKDLPPATPVDVRTDENGNAVVITAEVAAQVELLQNPAALLEEAFTNPAAAFAALGAIGADMSEEEREEATDMVVATVVAAGAAINAVGAAAGGATGGGTGGGGSSGGGSGANSPGSRGGRRW